MSFISNLLKWKAARWAGSGLGLIDPSTGEILNLVKTKRVAVILASLTVPTGTGSATPFDLVSVSDDPHNLADLINNYVNVPADAAALNIRLSAQWAASANGAARYLRAEYWAAGVVWVALIEIKAMPHATITLPCVIAPGQISINPVQQTRIRFTAMQDSGADLVCYPLGAASIEFVCA